MNNNMKNRIILTIRKLRKVIEHGERVTSEAEAKRTILRNDKEHTDSWKEPYYKTISDLENKQLRELGGSTRPLFDKLFETVHGMTNEFDYTDPALQSALNVINTLGDRLPHTYREQIIESFRGNPSALGVLKPLYAAHRFPTDTIEKMLAPFNSLSTHDTEVVTEFLGFATSPLVERNSWSTNAVKSMLDKYERSLGLDCSTNPYMKQIDEIYDNSKDPKQRATINAYRRKYGEKLEDGDSEAIEEAERLINNGFSTEVV